MYEDTTIAAIATAAGEGGIGIVRISGRDALTVASRLFCAKNLRNLTDAKPRFLYYGHVTDGDRAIDEGLAVYMPAPHSYTGEDVVELQMHGSSEALSETLALAFAAGALPAEPGAFTARAFWNGRLDLSQAEAVMDIITAKNRAALLQAESHLTGALSRYVKETRQALSDLIGSLEVTIDYPEEDLEEPTREETLCALADLEISLAVLLARAKNGRILKEGLRVSIVGRPNAGKSSLLNALLSEDRAIVTELPGTTRDTIEETIRIGGASVVLMDTAGLRETDNRIEQMGIERAKKSMETADLILAVFDASAPLTEEDRGLLTALSDKKALLLLNKSDLAATVSETDLHAVLPQATILSLSAQTGDGMPALEAALETAAGLQDIDDGRALVLTNARHTDLVRRALEAVRRAKSAAGQKLSADCLAVDLTEAYMFLGEITGETMDEDLIHAIFSRFCVGK